MLLILWKMQSKAVLMIPLPIWKLALILILQGFLKIQSNP